MKLRLLLLALVAAPLSAQTAAPPLPPELQTGLRCAALFSLIAADQVRGAPGASDWPPLAARGREFFVRVSARAMDAGKLDRPALQAVMQAEVNAVRQPATRVALKAPCLAMLDASISANARRQP
ncbi:MAG: hypothetical protein RL339_1219 [Pseudomonadota bacterium]|jgi:hypothetical protein